MPKTCEQLVADDTCDCAQITAIIGRHPDAPGSLIPILQDVQRHYSYLPEKAVDLIARRLRLSPSQIYGVATFYSQFRLKAPGRTTIRVCHGTACHVGGATGITSALEEELCVRDGETTADREFTLESVACLGCCSLAPVMTVGGETHGRLNPDAARAVVRSHE